MLEVADELWVAPQLWRAVRDQAVALPPAVVEHLREHHRANTVRNLRFRRRLTEIAAALNAAGVVPLLFKGAIRLVDADAGALSEWWMADIDLAVPQDAVEASTLALQRVGYRPNPGRPFLHPHELPFTHPHGPGPVELHVELGSAPIPSILPVTDAYFASTERTIGTARVRMLCPTHQALHNILHSAVQDLNHAVAGLSLRQLLALAQLEHEHGSAIDWQAIDASMEAAGLAAVLRDHLWLAHRLVGVRLPEGIHGDAGARLYEARVLVNFGLGWPADLHRNLRYAFGRAYLDSLYGHHDRPLKLAAARARHAARLARGDSARAAREAFKRRL